MKRWIFVLPVLALTACASPGDPPRPEPHAKGHELFLVNCKSCHELDRVVVGPALREPITTYWKDRAALARYINHPKRYMDSSGDARLQKLLKDYGIEMPAFPNLSAADIDSIAAYVAGDPVPGGSKQASENK